MPKTDGGFASPPVVAFRGQERIFGDATTSLSFSQQANVVANIAEVLAWSSAEVEAFVAGDCPNAFLWTPVLGQGEGGASFKVDVEYGGDGVRASFFPEQIAGMLVAALRRQAEAYFSTTEVAVSDLAYSLCLPDSCTPRERQAWMDAAKIAGLGDTVHMPLRQEALSQMYLVTHLKSHFPTGRATAAASTSASTSSTECEAKVAGAADAGAADEGFAAHTVLFVDMGHSSTSASLYRFSHAGGVQCLASRSDVGLGARNLDWRLYGHVCDLISKQCNVEVKRGSKLATRVMKQCAKVKEVLSTIKASEFVLENVKDDTDLRLSIELDDFVALCGEEAGKFAEMLSGVLAEGGVAGSDLTAVELVGGGCRIPFIQAAITGAIEEAGGVEGKTPLKFTLDSAAAVSLGGCASVAARVRAQVDAEAAKAAAKAAALRKVAEDAAAAAAAVKKAAEEKAAVDAKAAAEGAGEAVEAGEAAKAEAVEEEAVDKATAGEAVPATADAAAADTEGGDAKEEEEKKVGEKNESEAEAVGTEGTEGAGDTKKEGGHMRMLSRSFTAVEILAPVEGGLGDDAVASLVAKEQEMETRDGLVKARDEAKNDLASYCYDVEALATGGFTSLVGSVDVKGKGLLKLFNAEQAQAVTKDGEEFLDHAEDMADDGATLKFSVADIRAKLAEVKGAVEQGNVEFFAALKKEEEEKDRIMAAEVKEGEAERAAEKEAEDGEDDMKDTRKLKKADRMRMLMKQKDEGTELFKGTNYAHAAMRYQKALGHAAKFFDLSTESQAEVDAVKISLYLNLAQCFIKLEKWPKVMDNCAYALKVAPDNVKALYRRAFALEKTRRFDDAKADLKKAEKLAPEDKAIKKLAARVELQLKKARLKQKKMAQKMFA